MSMFPFLALCCLLYLFLTMLFCLHSYCIHQILDSVSYAHQHDIVHRDLKVCVCVRAFHSAAFVPSPHARAHCHFVCACVSDLPVPAVCPSMCLSLIFRASARLQALHLRLFLHYFGWSEAETWHHTRMLARAAYETWRYWHFWTDSTVKCAG